MFLQERSRNSVAKKLATCSSTACLGAEKQVAYSKVALNVVDVLTSEVVFSAQGAGEYALSDREVLGFGGASSYDSTLNGKVLDLAIREAVNHLVDGVEKGTWQPQKQ